MPQIGCQPGGQFLCLTMTSGKGLLCIAGNQPPGCIERDGQCFIGQPAGFLHIVLLRDRAREVLQRAMKRVVQRLWHGKANRLPLGQLVANLIDFAPRQFDSQHVRPLFFDQRRGRQHHLSFAIDHPRDNDIARIVGGSIDNKLAVFQPTVTWPRREIIAAEIGPLCGIRSQSVRRVDQKAHAAHRSTILPTPRGSPNKRITAYDNRPKACRDMKLNCESIPPLWQHQAAAV